MSQSLLYHAFGVRQGWDYTSTSYVEGRVEFALRARESDIHCPQCSSVRFWHRGSRERRIQSVPIGLKPVVLVTTVPRCECQDCGTVFEHSPLLPEPTCATPGASHSSSSNSARS